MPGHRPKPTALKLIQGNPGKRRLPVNEPRPPSEAPSCPTWLRREAKAEWRRIVPELAGLGLLTTVDRAALAAYCEAWAALHEATQDLRKGSVIEVVKSRFYNEVGNVYREEKIEVVNPAVRIQRQASALVRSYLVEFGLSPAARVKLTGQGGGKKASALEGAARLLTPSPMRARG